MLTRAEQARLTVVLVGARNPSNIGAAARAMQDFGFADLRIANDFSAPFEAAQLAAANIDVAQPAPKSAVGAAEVMLSARRFDNLLGAIADCTVVIGTTAIGERELTQPVLPLADVSPRILAALQSAASTVGRVALLFGSEKTGLTNEQLSHCELLTTIPMHQPEGARHLSMNLGQSVAVCLYELVRSGFELSRELPVLNEAPATVADRERLTQYVLQAMSSTGYARRFPANSREHVVRQLVQRLGESHLEATTWMAFFKQVLRQISEPL